MDLIKYKQLGLKTDKQKTSEYEELWDAFKKQ